MSRQYSESRVLYSWISNFSTRSAARCCGMLGLASPARPMPSASISGHMPGDPGRDSPSSTNASCETVRPQCISASSLAPKLPHHFSFLFSFASWQGPDYSLAISSFDSSSSQIAQNNWSKSFVLQAPCKHDMLSIARPKKKQKRSDLRACIKAQGCALGGPTAMRHLMV